MNNRQMVISVICPKTSEPEIERLFSTYLGMSGMWPGLDLCIFLDTAGAEQLKNLIIKNKIKAPASLVIHDKFDGSADSLAQELSSFSAEILMLPEALTPLISVAHCPVLVLPGENRWHKPHPIETFIVPLSGEKPINKALELALTLADQTKIPIDLLHVTAPGQSCCCDAALFDSLPDQAHHEYLQMVDKVVTEGSPFSHRHQRKWIRRLSHLSGNIPKKIIDAAKAIPNAVFVLEWNGIFESGRANTLKRILRLSPIPILLVRCDSHFQSNLNVATHFKSA